MRNNNPAHARRVREELLRISSSPAEIARKLGITSQSAATWLNCDGLPSIGGLETMYRAGLDILYVVSGERDDTLNRALRDIPHVCETCGNYCDGDLLVCEQYDQDCSRCPHNDTCRTCRHASNWHWRGTK